MGWATGVHLPAELCHLVHADRLWDHLTSYQYVTVDKAAGAWSLSRG